MRVVSTRELRELPLLEALERLREVEWVMDESATFIPAEEFARSLRESRPRVLTHQHKVAMT